MARILSRTFIAAQLAQVGITSAQLDAMSIQDKIAALSAVAKASYAADSQGLFDSQKRTLDDQDILLKQQQASYTKAGFLPT